MFCFAVLNPRLCHTSYLQFMAIFPHNSRNLGVLWESSGIQCATVVVANVSENFSYYTETVKVWCSLARTQLLSPAFSAIKVLAYDLVGLAIRENADPAAAQREGIPGSEPGGLQKSWPHVLDRGSNVRIAAFNFGTKANTYAVGPYFAAELRFNAI